MLSRVKNRHGGMSKDRITVLLYTNTDGSENMLLMVTGKSEKLRCFKHVKSLSCTYSHNSTARMACALFMEHDMFRTENGSQNQIILLFVDQCAAYTTDTSKLRNVRVEFLLANTTLVLQKGINR
jgi:hypothetical protein